MELSQAISLFVFEALLLLTVLCVCLKFAATQHKKHLKTIISQINKTHPDGNDVGEKANNTELRERLMKKIRKLQNQVRALELIEKKYYDLVKDNERSSNERGKEAEKNSAYTIAVGTTADRDAGVDKSYTDYLSKKSLLRESVESTDRIDHQSRAMNSKLDQQREVIKSLKNQVDDYRRHSDVAELKSEEQEKTLRTIEQLEKLLSGSQRTSEKLGVELSKVKKDFARASTKLAQLQADDVVDGEASETRSSPDTYNIISKRGVSDEEHRELDEFEEEALKNYKALKVEVVNLRDNVTEQRRLMFALESQVMQLKKELESGDLEEGAKQIKQDEVSRLEKLLKETEGCVEILESEVGYLQGKIKSFSEKNETSEDVSAEDPKEISKALKTEVNRLERELDVSNLRLETGRVVREGLSSSIEKVTKEAGLDALEVLTAGILDIMKPLNIRIHLAICSRLGNIETSNTNKMEKSKISTLTHAIHSKHLGLADDGSGFTVTFSRLGVYAEGSPTSISSLGAINETLSFILLIANTTIITVEERHFSESRQLALKKIVEGAKKNLNTISVQTRYQSEEAKRIQDNFFKELNECLHTLNISENQSRIFNEMIDEAHERMKVLFASEVVVDSSFKKLIEKLESGTKHYKSSSR